MVNAFVFINGIIQQPNTPPRQTATSKTMTPRHTPRTRMRAARVWLVRSLMRVEHEVAFSETGGCAVFLSTS